MKRKLLITLVVLFLAQLSNAQIPQLWGIASNGGLHGDGSILKINGDASGFAVAYSLTGTDGSFPGGHLALNSDRMFYGMTFEGGAHNFGTIFRIDPATNIYTDLYDIDTLGNAWVNSDLVRGNDSIFYGLIYEGGPDSLGELFQFNISDSVYTLLYQFNIATGAHPRSIMMASNHKLYGTTDLGGANSEGGIYSYDPATNTYTDLHDNDSTTSLGAPVQAGDGKLYGLTNGGGVASWGSIYSYDPSDNMYTKLHDFDITSQPGWINGLTADTNGMLYGMNETGGSDSVGIIFRFNTVGDIYTKLFDFTASSGNGPISNMMLASDGNLYGMTVSGGTYSGGTIFKFNIADSTFSKLKDLTNAAGENPYGGLTELPPPTGIAERTLSDNIQIYPNPVTNQLVLHFSSIHANGDLTVSIMNTLGEVIMVENKAWQTDLFFDTQRLSTGMYFIKINNENVNWLGKFVKE